MHHALSGARAIGFVIPLVIGTPVASTADPDRASQATTHRAAIEHLFGAARSRIPTATVRVAVMSCDLCLSTVYDRLCDEEWIATSETKSVDLSRVRFAPRPDQWTPTNLVLGTTFNPHGDPRALPPSTSIDPTNLPHLPAEVEARLAGTNFSLSTYRGIPLVARVEKP
jgi:hypothetical protein